MKKIKLSIALMMLFNISLLASELEDTLESLKENCEKGNPVACDFYAKNKEILIKDNVNIKKKKENLIDKEKNKFYLDKQTYFMWHNESVKKNWNEAIYYCENLVSAGYTDWRLPSINELSTIVESCGGDMKAKKGNNLSNSKYQSCYKDKNFLPYFYWSSDEHVMFSFAAWSMYFELGDKLWYEKTRNDTYALCVRG